ncbi:hypothetical protein J3R03_000727 [Actinoplanes couchii]|nr:hypothetical protein [Actinoplanes couchii]
MHVADRPTVVLRDRRTAPAMGEGDERVARTRRIAVL